MTRRLIGVLLAIILAIAGTGAVFAYVSSAQNRVADGQEAVRVLIANERIPAGTSGASLKERELLREVVMPKLSVPDDALSAVPEDFDGLVLTSDMQPQQLLMRGAFGNPTTLSGGLGIPEAMVAVSVRVDVDQQVAGFIRPGSQIAIFNTYESDDDDEIEEGADNRRTRLLLPRVEVLAVGVYGEGGVTTASANGDEDEEEEAVGGLDLTVSVDQDGAERLIHATRTGQLYLALLTDTSEIEPGPGVDSRTLFP